uniref:Uncharacterized protein n=1 Tax=Arundo donax TaxID=35708 RepID=A0A0A9AQ92_ARUDO
MCYIFCYAPDSIKM